MKNSIIKAITSGLGFFVLSLLIVESFLTAVLVLSDLDQKGKFIGMLIGASLFLIVVVIVAFLVKTCPQNLMFGEKSLFDLEKEKMKKGSQERGTKEIPPHKIVEENKN